MHKMCTMNKCTKKYMHATHRYTKYFDFMDHIQFKELFSDVWVQYDFSFQEINTFIQ